MQVWRHQGLVCYCGVLSFFLSYFDIYYLRILSVEGYCCILTDTHRHTHTDSHSHTHTHILTHIFSRNSLYQGSGPRNVHHSLENIYTTGRIRTRIACNQAAQDLRLRPRGHRNWRLWSYKFQSDIGSGYVIVK